MSRKRHRTALLRVIACVWFLVAGSVSLETSVASSLPDLPDEGFVVIDTNRLPAKQPLVYRVDVESSIEVKRKQVTTLIKGEGDVLSGQGHEIVLGLIGDAPVSGVRGNEIAAWAERRSSDGARQLVMTLVQPVGEKAGEGTNASRPFAPRHFQFEVVAEARLDQLPARIVPTLLLPGLAAGWSARVVVQSGEGVAWDVSKSEGLTPSSETTFGKAVYLAGGDVHLELRVSEFGAVEPAAELREVSLTGVVSEDGSSMEFLCEGKAVVREDGAIIPVLGGQAALLAPGEEQVWVPLVLPETVAPAASGLKVVGAPSRAHTGLFFEKKGTYPVTMRFVAEVGEVGGWRALDFVLLVEPPVRMTVSVSGEEVAYREREGAKPISSADGVIRMPMSADGGCRLAWRQKRGETLGALFVEVKVGHDLVVEPGAVREKSDFEFDVLQGSIVDELVFRVEGDGEVIGVEGEIAGEWQVDVGDEGQRMLRVKLLRPMNGKARLEIASQMAVGALGHEEGHGKDNQAATIKPVKLTPLIETLRMSGLVRLRAQGAVEFAVSGAEGLIQLAPDEWGSDMEKSEGVDRGQQMSVFRFPLPDFGMRLSLARIYPEVAIKQTLVYHLDESERRIEAEIELDIRKAAIREWEVDVPDGYAVASAAGADLADAAPAKLSDGSEAVRLVFQEPVLGRSVVRLTLERSEPGRAGEWQLPPIKHPGASTVRGFVGVATALLYRLAEGKSSGLAEVPVSLFPMKGSNLQAAYRIREGDWSLAFDVALVDRSVAADVFHLYTLKEDGVAASILLNYFVVGAPVNEWRVEVPEGAVNISVVGLDVRTWRNEGREVNVSLDRPVKGAATLLVTFEVMAEDGHTSMQLDGVKPLDVQSEQGFMQITSPLQVRHEVVAISGGVSSIDESELPKELRWLASAPSVAAFEYARRPFGLDVGIDWFRQAELLRMAVDLASLESKVSHDGQVMTTARYFLKSSEPSMLRVKLPQGAGLWDASVDGRVVTARSEGEFTLVPISGRGDEVCEVALRFGVAKKGLAQRVRLYAPVLDVPVLTTLWKAEAEGGRVLVSRGSGHVYSESRLPATGFQWLGDRFGLVGWLTVICGLGLWVVGRRGRRSMWRVVAKYMLLLLALGSLGATGLIALADSGRFSESLKFSASVLAGGRAIDVVVWNLPVWAAGLSLFGLVLMFGGLWVLSSGFFGWRKESRFLGMTGWALVSTGLLMQHGGAIWFLAWAFVSLGVVVGRALLRPSVLATSVVFIGVSIPSLHTQAAMHDETLVRIAALDQTLVVEGKRVVGEARLVVFAKASGETFPFLAGDAKLAGFESEGLVARVISGSGVGYVAVAKSAGRQEARARYEYDLDGDGMVILLPTSSAASQTVRVDIAQSGWTVRVPNAVRTAQRDSGGHSIVELTLAPARKTTLYIEPMPRDLSSEEAVFLAETSAVYLIEPGAINGWHRVGVNVVRGQIGKLQCLIPEGLLVSHVGGSLFGGAASDWRFDPVGRVLTMELPKKMSGEMSLEIQTRAAIGALPSSAVLGTLRVAGAQSDNGRLSIAFGGGARSQSLKPSGATLGSANDFRRDEFSKLPEGLAVQSTYWCDAAEDHVEVAVAQVEAELRVVAEQTLSLGDERTVLAVDLGVDIRRAGIFEMRFALPSGFEVETVSGAVLSHWTEVMDGGMRMVVLYLNGQTQGQHEFHFSLESSAVRAQESWQVPRFELVGAERMTGTLTIVPVAGLRLQALERQNLTNAETASGAVPGALAFRLLRGDWSLRLGIEQLDAWIAATTLEEITVREGMARHRVAISAQVENASVSNLRLRMRGLGEEGAGTVRVSGEAAAGIERTQEGDEWLLTLRKRVIGKLELVVEYQMTIDPEANRLEVQPLELVDVGSATCFLTIRSSGRMAIDMEENQNGWQRVDWNTLPEGMMDATSGVTGGIALRAQGASNSVALNLGRLDAAESLDLRMVSGKLASVFATSGASVTVGTFSIQVNERSAMRVRLPEGASLFGVMVNGLQQATSRDGDMILFHVLPDVATNEPTEVVIAYLVSGGDRVRKRIRLEAPGFEIPVENINWQVRLPEGWVLAGYAGALELAKGSYSSSYDVEDYLKVSSLLKESRGRKTRELIAQADEFLKRGQQSLARDALSKAAAQPGLDEAAGEDARIQLRNLANQQAVIGINTLRQKLYLENRSAEESDAGLQMEQSARSNPLLQGQTDFDPRQIDSLLVGNTGEETSALRRIADRLMARQASAEVAPNAVKPTLPDHGELVTFTRSVQIDGSKPLVIDVKLKRSERSAKVVSFAIFLLLFVFAATYHIGVQKHIPD